MGGFAVLLEELGHQALVKIGARRRLHVGAPPGLRLRVQEGLDHAQLLHGPARRAGPLPEQRIQPQVAGGHPAVGVVAVGVVEQQKALRVREEVGARRVDRLQDERVAALDAPVLGPEGVRRGEADHRVQLQLLRVAVEGLRHHQALGQAADLGQQLQYAGDALGVEDAQQLLVLGRVPEDLGLGPGCTGRWGPRGPRWGRPRSARRARRTRPP